jgi:hypothetical protein
LSIALRVSPPQSSWVGSVACWVTGEPS